MVNNTHTTFGFRWNHSPVWVWLMVGTFCLGVAHRVQAETAKPEISIEGGSAELQENIRQYLSLANENCNLAKWKLNSLLGDAENEIQQAAQALGYYQLTYSTELSFDRLDSDKKSSNKKSINHKVDSDSNSNPQECWRLHIVLDPKDPVKITAVTVEVKGDGEQDDAIKQLLVQNPLRIGDQLNHGLYEKYKNQLSNLASSHGYFDAGFEQAQIFVDIENKSASIYLIYDTKRRYKIGKIQMRHEILSEEFIQRYLTIKTGDFYDTDKLLEQKTLFNATNYFSIATASPDLQHIQDYQVPIEILLEERKQFAYELGAGFATDTRARVSLGVEDRYVNNSGHSIKADFSQSLIKKTAQLAYVIPMENPTYEFLKFYTGYEREETDTTISKKNTYGASYTYYPTDTDHPNVADSARYHWLHTYAVNMENEWSAVVNQSYNYSHLIIPSLTISRIQTDISPYPLNGWNTLARLSGSPQTFGSDISYLQFYLRAKRIFNFAQNDCALCSGRILLRTEIGATRVTSFPDLPISVRYFAGGDTSVRGYEYKSLGPPDATGKVMGGKNLIVNSAEYDFLIKPKWAIAAFYDIGNAANDFSGPLKRGAGFGVRWISPIGPVRVDIARALDAPLGWQLHITMGPDL